jgi:RNA polymerase sigma factor, sigma-70 family
MELNNFAEIYHANFLMVYKVCFAMLKSRPEAEDCAEDTFVKLLEKRPVFLTEKDAKAWLTITAMNRCKDHLRSWWHRNRESMDDLNNELGDSAVSDQGGTMLDSIQELPMKYRELLILFYYEGYSTDEIAKMLHRPSSTVRNQLKDARQMLKIRLENDSYGV